MPTLTARLKSVESKLLRGRDAQAWEQRRSHMAADLDTLRDCGFFGWDVVVIGIRG